jgi:hypothetical protein
MNPWILQEVAAERAADLRRAASVRATRRALDYDPGARGRASAVVRLGRLVVRLGERISGEEAISVRGRHAAV